MNERRKAKGVGNVKRACGGGSRYGEQAEGSVYSMFYVNLPKED